MQIYNLKFPIKPDEQNPTMPNVLILSGRAPVALDHARRFAQQGWTAYIGDSIACRLSSWSRAVAGTVKLAPPRSDPAGFIADLRQTITRLGIDLVVPTCEEVFYLSRYRTALPTTCRLAVDEFDKLRLLHSKWDFQALAQRCGGNPPPSAVVYTLDEARDWVRATSDGSGEAGVVLKPEFSRFGVYVRLYPQGIPDNAPPLVAQGRWVVQRHRAGTELCSYSIADRGRLLAHAVYRPAYRLPRSSSYYFDHHISPAIHAFVSRLVAQIDFTGQISFDWIDAGDDTPSVIECNPRAISGLHLFGLADAVPAALTGEALNCAMPTATRARMIAPIMLSTGLAQAINSGALSKWRADWCRADDVLTRDGDALPCAGGLVDVGSYARLAILRGSTLREATSRDLEWDGEELAAL